MIPHEISQLGIEQAIIEIDRNGIPQKRKSRFYSVEINNKQYPPKYVISLAAKFDIGKEFLSEDFSAVEAKNYFSKRGFKVIDNRAIEEIEKEIIPENEESSFAEGKESYVIHRSLERDTTMPKKAKAKRLKETGKLECDICGMDFYEVYGDIGYGFIEAHHTIPVSKISNQFNTKISDFALVCSNCHSMLHHNKKLLSVSDLISIVRKQKQLCVI